MGTEAGTLFLQPCASYDRAMESVSALLERSGYTDRIHGKNLPVLVKPNLLHAAAPDDASTTHPEVVKGVVRALQHRGHRPIIGDSYSGAFPWSRRGLERVYSATGMADVAQATGCELSFDLEWVHRSILNGSALGRIEVLRLVERVACIVNVPKLKTHSYTGFSCATKNLFGVVPGHFKVSYHARFSLEHRFSMALLDIAQSLPVAFTIADGIVAMEGEGPAAGDPRPVGTLIAGDDVMAVDRIAARLCGFAPGSIPWLGQGQDMIVGRAPEELIPGGLRKATPHQLDMGVFRNPWVRRVARRILKDAFSRVPVIGHTRCVGCQICVTACPVGAMTWRRDFPHVDRARCIRCYCCHEACQSRAISIPRSWLVRVLT